MACSGGRYSIPPQVRPSQPLICMGTLGEMIGHHRSVLLNAFLHCIYKASIQQRVSQSHSQISCDNQLSCIAIASPADLLYKCMNYPPFVLQLDTKNTYL